MNTQDQSYTPRTGSKVSRALIAMTDGPVQIGELAIVLECPEGRVATLLHQALANNLVVKVQDATRLPHMMKADQDLPEGFSFCTARPAVDLPDPADPFGLVGRKKRARAGGKPEDVAPAAKPPAPLAPAKPAAPASEPATSNETGSRAGGAFVAALFSTGELMIQVGDDQVFLTQDHQLQLQAYCERFGG